MIYISGDNLEAGLSLQSYSAKTTTKGSVLTIQLAISDPLKLGFYLKDLAELAEAQKRKPLALPAPSKGGQ
jgi:hypothetical protein